MGVLNFARHHHSMVDCCAGIFPKNRQVLAEVKPVGPGRSLPRDKFLVTIAPREPVRFIQHILINVDIFGCADGMRNEEQVVRREGQSHFNMLLG
jgi:hypothetical protein